MRNYAFFTACVEAYEMCILLHRSTRSSFAPAHQKCVLIFLRTVGAGGPRRWSPRRSSPSSRAACGRASRAREKRKIPCPSSRTALSNVKQKCPIWIKCRLTTYVHRVDLLRNFRPSAANLHLQRTLLLEEAGQKKTGNRCRITFRKLQFGT